MATADLRAELSCSICMDIYTDPVTLRCGHNFCRVCITTTWDHQEEGEYTCPECMHKFRRRPDLKRNLRLCNIAEAFTQKQEAVDKIICTYCGFPAVKSCLHCKTSMCDNHLRTHDRSVEHTIIPPTVFGRERQCSIHKKFLVYYCTEDTVCICASCRLGGEHRGHLVVSLDEAWVKKKEKLRNVMEKLTSKREETERRAQRLQECKNEVQDKAAGVTIWVASLFRDIRRQLEDLEKRVVSEISRQEEQVLLPVSDLIQQLEVKTDELSRKMRHIEELCNKTDPVTFLQQPDKGDLYDTQDGDNEDRERHDKQVHDVGNLDEGFISEILRTGLSEIIRYVNVWIYMKEPTDVLLDVSTAGNDLHISGDLKTVSWSRVNQNRPETPERFQSNQVLSTRSFSSGRHYWEVEMSKSGWCEVGMCYPSIDRKGDQSDIGYNNKSWCLCRWINNQYLVIHDSEGIQLPHNISCDRVRIYLDYEAGQLSFYALCDPIRHLHTFTAAFTEPLHAVLCVWRDCSIKISGVLTNYNV
ncbi:E3 ubiquitin-protein ligase TRIM39-like [Mixophyes fleayi]|uniref:E3 ubiquitin-protein ligase TRIM39-like n=1 Tax=Mixophyes fleayi TaxID=3061075 RepID=UPI003F4DCDD5